MKANWARVITENMESLEVPGREAPIFKPRGSVWIFTELGEFPPVPPPLDRLQMNPCGGRELDLDASDPDFLLVHKSVGVCEYSHCIPWEKIVDIVFYQATV
jgi:hypothetical protein